MTRGRGGWGMASHDEESKSTMAKIKNTLKCTCCSRATSDPHHVDPVRGRAASASRVDLSTSLPIPRHTALEKERATPTERATIIGHV